MPPKRAKPSPRSKSGPGLPVVSSEAARLLLMDAQGLLQCPSSRANPASLYRLIEQMGFVQLDTISVAERAHHHILLTRLDAYRPALLDRLHADRRLFEHMTHDASLIPTVFFPYWRARFERCFTSEWWKKKLGEATAEVVASVLERIRVSGPVRSRDFERDSQDRGASGGWWEWRPHKTALEFLWRTGAITIASRDQFQKVYDLTERVYPEAHALARPTPEEHVDWACRTALARLGVANAREIAQFWNAITLAEARAWCEGAAARGEVLPVALEAGAATRGGAYAVPDWRARLERARARLAALPLTPRLLSPFDPVIRDRQRTLRLFGFDYSFEAFVPAKKRRYGYYTLPVLRGDRLIARLDPKLHRERRALEVRALWWEPSVRATRRDRAALEESLIRFGAAIGAERVQMPE